MKANTIFVIIVSMIIIFSGCIEEEFSNDKLSKSIELEADVAVPIGYTTLSLTKFLTENTQPEELIIRDDGFMLLQFREKVFSLKASDLIKIPAVDHTTVLENTFPVDLDLTTFSIGIILRDTAMVEIGFDTGNGERLDSIKLKSSELILEITPFAGGSIDGYIEVLFPTLTLNGVPYSTSIDLATGKVVDKNLEDYVIGLEHPENLTNILPVDYALYIQSGTGIVPAGQSIIDLSISFSFIDYKEVYGFLGNHSINIPLDGFVIDFYDEIIEGVFHFEAPEIRIFFNNSFGVPLGITLPDFYATNRDKSTTTIIGGGITDVSNPYIIKYPTIQQVGEYVPDTLILNPDNINMFEVLENAPVGIDFSVTGLTNPNITDGTNFITEDSNFDVEVELELPLWGYADILVMQDTMRFEVDELYDSEIEELKQLTFRLNFKNGFPVEINSQIYFADASYQILDSLFIDDNLIEGAIDSDGDEIFEPVDSPVLSVTIDRDKVEKIESTKYILIRGRIATTDAAQKQNVKFYSFYTLEANLGVIATIETNTSQL